MLRVHGGNENRESNDNEMNQSKNFRDKRRRSRRIHQTSRPKCSSAVDVAWDAVVDGVAEANGAVPGSWISPGRWIKNAASCWRATAAGTRRWDAVVVVAAASNDVKASKDAVVVSPTAAASDDVRVVEDRRKEVRWRRRKRARRPRRRNASPSPRRPRNEPRREDWGKTRSRSRRKRKKGPYGGEGLDDADDDITVIKGGRRRGWAA